MAVTATAEVAGTYNKSWTIKAVSVTSVTVAHGLGAAPLATDVLIMPMHVIWYTLVPIITTIDATNIVLTVVSDATDVQSIRLIVKTPHSIGR